ncbi:hypothetical protein SNOG_02206 [Parastagonospora nodorum SN15]|uniref:Uncharacterized protein n=1 Tax=Phaeosphaeria nodorum (strain SN15 / ATCC MYA-4574 / FGSC 10173) TaxID=321614 RepID=Q0V1A8_PHANO|nr:hypothetical protein SNOG_02206 [Parastagonospora nodorum SN15]EAT90418.1 hypothetical protein SNOG_02206 [Parastagonospora nodorum SN15]
MTILEWKPRDTNTQRCGITGRQATQKKQWGMQACIYQ